MSSTPVPKSYSPQVKELATSGDELDSPNTARLRKNRGHYINLKHSERDILNLNYRGK